MLSASHTPLAQRDETPFEHVPLAGMIDPVAALATHVLIAVLHQSVVAQSPSVMHPPDGIHVSFVEHAPERHRTVLPKQGPVPFGRPHRSSAVSQTPVAQTMAPTAVVHVPSSVGVWPADVGTGRPFAMSTAHVLATASHHCALVQLESVTHAFEQAPVA